MINSNQNSVTDAAEKFSKNAPCTNHHPINCPLCPKGLPSVWKYNLLSHIRTTHPSANPGLYSSLYTITEDENSLLLAEYLRPRRATKAKKSRSQGKMVISEAHTTRIAARYVNTFAL